MEYFRSNLIYPGGINLIKEERQLCSYLTEKGVAFRQQVCRGTRPH